MQQQTRGRRRRWSGPVLTWQRVPSLPLNLPHSIPPAFVSHPPPLPLLSALQAPSPFVSRSLLRQVRDYLFKVAKFWLGEVGVDGWRLDVAHELPPAFWRDFRTACTGPRRQSPRSGLRV